jgi:photosystem II stability/assembly factor-like uncharacterized protein
MPDSAVLGTFKWRSIGPERGGRSLTVTGVKGQPNVGYFGATGGGLWKTTDKGVTWTAVTDGQITSSSVGAVAVSETNPDIVFIGTGESCIRGNIQPGDGMYKSTDAGKTWTFTGFRDGQNISKIRIHPTNPDVVFAAVFGHYGAPNDERGIYKTTDGGKTWRRVLFRDNKTAGVDLWIDRNHPDVIYAALWEAFRMEYTMSSGGPGSGLFKSTDGGEHWTEITRNPGLPEAGLIGKIGVTVSGADSNRVYAIVENDNGGVFRSDDAGATWKLVNTGRNLRQRAFYYTHITADPHNKDLVYALNVGAFKSTDGGQTFTNFAGGDSHDLWVDPDDSNHVMHASDSGGALAAHVFVARVCDRAVLPRHHDQARAVSRVRRAAGQQHDLRAEQRRTGWIWPRRAWGRRRRGWWTRRTGGRSARRDVQRRRRGARLHRDRSEGPGHFLLGRQQRVVPRAAQSPDR